MTDAAPSTRRERVARIARALIEETSEPTAERVRRSQGLAEKVINHRAVKQVRTTVALLEERGQLDRHHVINWHNMLVYRAMSMGVAAAESDLYGGPGPRMFQARSSKGIVNYDGSSGSAPGSRTLSDKQLKGQRIMQRINGAIPEGLWGLFQDLLREEDGMVSLGPLLTYGREYGFSQEQQARASGATQVRDIIEIVALAMRQ